MKTHTRSPSIRLFARSAVASAATLCVLGVFALAAPASAATPPLPDVGSLPGLPEVAPLPPVIDDVVLNVGANDAERNLAWFSTSGVPEVAQLAVGPVLAGEAFPAERATDFASTSGLAYTVTDTFHHTSVTDLSAGTDYVYRVGSDAGGWSETSAFTVEAADGDFSFLFMGDPQLGSSGDVAADTAGWVSTLDTALGAFPGTDFIVSAGDQVNVPTAEVEYDGFFAPEQLRSVPLATNIGNHDVNGSAYSQHFAMPNVSTQYGLGNPGESGENYWYLYKGVLFLSVNSNDRDNEEHIAFLKQTIADHGAEAKWTVLSFHHSIYSTALHAEDADVLERRAELSADISKLNIDLVLMGHDHVYVRTFLMDGTTPLSETGGDYLTPGDGQVLYVTANSSTGSKHYSPAAQGYAYAAVQNQENVANYTNISVTNTELTITTYRSADSSVVDRVTLAKPNLDNSLVG